MWTKTVLLLMLVHLSASYGVDKAPCPGSMRISVVFSCFLWPDQDWELLIRSQLENLVTNGLAECAVIHVVMTVPSSHTGFTYDELEGLLAKGRHLVHSILPIRRPGNRSGAVVTQVHENSFEYPAIHLLWLLAQVRHWIF